MLNSEDSTGDDKLSIGNGFPMIWKIMFIIVALVAVAGFFMSIFYPSSTNMDDATITNLSTHNISGQSPINIHDDIDMNGNQVNNIGYYQDQHFYVAADGGGGSDENPGTSKDSPLASVSGALSKFGPYSRMTGKITLLRGTHTISDSVWDITQHMNMTGFVIEAEWDISDSIQSFTVDSDNPLKGLPEKFMRLTTTPTVLLEPGKLTKHLARWTSGSWKGQSMWVVENTDTEIEMCCSEVWKTQPSQGDTFDLYLPTVQIIWNGNLLINTSYRSPGLLIQGGVELLPGENSSLRTYDNVRVIETLFRQNSGSTFTSMETRWGTALNAGVWVDMVNYPGYTTIHGSSTSLIRSVVSRDDSTRYSGLKISSTSSYFEQCYFSQCTVIENQPTHSVVRFQHSRFTGIQTEGLIASMSQVAFIRTSVLNKTYAAINLLSQCTIQLHDCAFDDNHMILKIAGGSHAHFLNFDAEITAVKNTYGIHLSNGSFITGLLQLTKNTNFGVSGVNQVIKLGAKIDYQTYEEVMSDDVGARNDFDSLKSESVYIVP
jgi:hypothetical protein